MSASSSGGLVSYKLIYNFLSSYDLPKSSITRLRSGNLNSSKNSDEIYFIISGHGLAGAGSDRVEVRGGHFHFIPKGVDHWLYNLSAKDPIEVVGVYCEAGSVSDTGYVYKGDVTTKDLEERTT